MTSATAASLSIKSDRMLPHAHRRSALQSVSQEDEVARVNGRVASKFGAGRHPICPRAFAGGRGSAALTGETVEHLEQREHQQRLTAGQGSRQGVADLLMVLVSTQPLIGPRAAMPVTSRL